MSVIFRVALRAPVLVGLNVTLIVQLAPAANELPHPLSPKSPGSAPMIVILLIVIAVVPTFFIVIVLSAVLPTVTEPKFRLVAESSAVVPIPLRGSFCGLPLALSVKVRVALRAPVAVGLNVTVIVQLADAARDAPQVVPVSGKSPASVPVTAMLVIVIAVVPTFFSVTIFAVLVTPTAKVPKLRLLGVISAVVPMPLTGTC